MHDARFSEPRPSPGMLVSQKLNLLDVGNSTLEVSRVSYGLKDEFQWRIDGAMGGYRFHGE